MEAACRYLELEPTCYLSLLRIDLLDPSEKNHLFLLRLELHAELMHEVYRIVFFPLFKDFSTFTFFRNPKRFCLN